VLYKQLTRWQWLLAITIAVIITLFYLFFNFNYLSNWVDEKGDVNTYDYYVRLGIPSYLFNPHHIAFDWLGQQFYLLCQKAGYTGSVMHILQLRNLVISSLGLGILFICFYRMSKKPILSILMVSMIAFSGAYWMYSQINDTPIIHSIMICLLFCAALYFPQAKHKKLYAVFLGLFHSITIFFHQSDVLFAVVITFIILLGPWLVQHFNQVYERTPVGFLTGNSLQTQFHNPLVNKTHWKELLIYGSVMIATVILTYYYVGIVLLGLTFDPEKATTFNEHFEGASYFFNWLVLYSKIDYWGKGYEDAGLLAKVINGVSTYFYQPVTLDGSPVTLDIQAPFSAHSILPSLALVFVLGVIAATILLFIPLFKHYHFIFGATLLFAIVYISFACWWEPDYREFWVAPMFSIWMLAFFLFDFLLDKLRGIRPLPGLLLYGWLGLFALLLFFFNFTGFIYPHAGVTFKQFDIVQNRIENIRENPRSQ
jgi:hypothetical protein